MPNYGVRNVNDGTILDQQQLLMEIGNGLAVYNQNDLDIIDRFARTTTKQTERVAQAPLEFQRHASGGDPYRQRMLYRMLRSPLVSYDLSTAFTVEGLMDALPSDVTDTVDGAMLGDTDLLGQLFFGACLSPQTPGSAGMNEADAYQASFYNGETDVPFYKQNQFSGAHSHYYGLNTTTPDRTHVLGMKKHIQEHGYGRGDGKITVFYNSGDEVSVLNLADTNGAGTILQSATPQRVSAIDAGVNDVGYKIHGVWFVSNDNIPQGYWLALANDIQPMSKRVHHDPSYQGLMLFRESFNEQFPLAGTKFMRRTGFSCRHLGAGVAVQLVASTSYTAPSMRIV